MKAMEEKSAVVKFLIEISIENLIEGLRLTVIGMSLVISTLFGLEVLVRVLARIWGPKAKTPPAEKEGGA